MHAEDELAGHAELDAHLGVLGVDDLDGAQRGPELRVARGAGRVEVDRVGARLPHGVGHAHGVDDGHLGGLLRRRPRLVDAPHRQQGRPVVAGPVVLGVQAEVRHDAVLHRRDRAQQRVVQALRLVGQDRADHLERVVAGAELEQVGAHPLLVRLHVLGARGVRLHAGAVAAQHDLVAEIHAHDAGRRGVDIEDMVLFFGGERRHLGTLDRLGDAVLDVGAQLAARETDERAVAHARRDARFHGLLLTSGPPCDRRHTGGMPAAGDDAAVKLMLSSRLAGTQSAGGLECGSMPVGNRRCAGGPRRVAGAGPRTALRGAAPTAYRLATQKAW